MYKILLALAVVAVMACGAVAGEVSQGTLSDMGLSSMQSMSDDDGMAVRGKWAFVGGIGTATVIGGTSQTTVFAAGGNTAAIGGNASVAVTVVGGVLLIGGNPAFVIGQGSFAGGIAGARSW